MARHSSRRRRPLLFFSAVAVATSFACSGGGLGAGCAGSCLGPIPTNGGWYQGPKTDDPVSVRLSQAGISYINQNWQSLLSGLAPGGVLNVPIPCSVQNTAVGDFVIADQGRPGCNSQSCGRMDGKCDGNQGSATYDAPANVPIQITGLTLQAQPPDTVVATIKLTINSPKIYIDTVDQGYAGCLGLSPAECSVDVRTSNVSPPYNQIAATLQFSIDPTWDKLLAFNITQLNGTSICSNGPTGNCIDPGEIDLNGENTCGGVWCGGIGNFVKDYILPYVAPLIQSFVMSTIGQQTCEQCNHAADLPCMENPPTSPNSTSTCSSGTGGVCNDDQNAGKCVPRFLGLQGRLAPASLLGKYGVPASSQVDLSLALGSAVTVDTGISLSTRGGINAVAQASCVPSAPAPSLPQLVAPDFDADAPAGSTYHVALGVSQPFLDLSMYEVQQSGALCLAVGSSQFGIINTGTFKTFLPSLGMLATRDGKDAPMLVALRPQSPPTITIGAGTYDPVTMMPIDPLLNLNMKNMTIDFYAMFDDRYARLFSLTADISLPLSLIFNGCSTVEPALGDLKMLITNIRPSTSEILAEDPGVLKDLIPAVLGFAQPAIAGILKPFNLPALGGFKVKVDAAKGVQQITGTSNYNYMGFYAELLPANAMCATAAPTTVAKLRRAIIPEASRMRLAGHELPVPTAVLSVEMQGMNGTAEYDYRVDEGLWHLFAPANAQGELWVSDPAFLIQGRHLIEVRSRTREDPHGISAPVAVGFLVDWDAPAVAIEADHAHGTLTVTAHDAVTPDAELVYSYQVGSGGWSSFGAARPVDLAAVDAAGGLQVQVRDEAGNVGQASYRPPVVASLPDDTGAGTSLARAPRGGCTATGGELGLVGLWGLAAWAWRRRRRGR